MASSSSSSSSSRPWRRRLQLGGRGAGQPPSVPEPPGGGWDGGQHQQQGVYYYGPSQQPPPHAHVTAAVYYMPYGPYHQHYAPMLPPSSSYHYRCHVGAPAPPPPPFPPLPLQQQRGEWWGPSGALRGGSTPMQRPPSMPWHLRAPLPMSMSMPMPMPMPQPPRPPPRRSRGSRSSSSSNSSSNSHGPRVRRGHDDWPFEHTPEFPQTGRDDEGAKASAQTPPVLPFLPPRTALLPEDPARAAVLREHVARVLEPLHLVAPFLTSPDLLQLSAVSRGWTRAYRGAVTELRVGEPPPGRRSGHWTSMLTLLATLKGLRSLQVTHAHSVFPLAKCLGFRLTDRLASLDVSHVRICRTDEQRLLTALGEGCAPSLTTLSLVDCGLGDRGAALLAAALHAGGLGRLQELDVSMNRIRRGAGELAEGVVAGCPDVRVVVLAGNPLGPEGAQLLVEGFAAGAALASTQQQQLLLLLQQPQPHHSRLHTLNLTETGLEPDGCAALCQGLLLLSQPPTGPLRRLRSLVLNANGLGNAGLASLVAVLREGALPLLNELDVGRNYIDNDGLGALVGLLADDGGGAAGGGACLGRLRRLNLAFNLVTGQGARALVGALDAAAALRSLDLYQNEVSDAERQELQAEVREHWPQLELVV